MIKIHSNNAEQNRKPGDAGDTGIKNSDPALGRAAKLHGCQVQAGCCGAEVI